MQQGDKIMAEQAPIQKVTVEVTDRKTGVKQTIVLDPENMKYNENSLADFMNKEYGWIDYLGKQLEFAQTEVLYAEIELEAIESRKFMEAKDLGNSDNYAKAYTAANQEVIEAKKNVVAKKEIVGHLKAHLKAWDKNHANAQNRGHTIRKEMDKLNRDFYEDSASSTYVYESK